jgi:hypothetical protein
MVLKIYSTTRLEYDGYARIGPRPGESNQWNGIPFVIASKVGMESVGHDMESTLRHCPDYIE